MINYFTPNPKGLAVFLYDCLMFSYGILEFLSFAATLTILVYHMRAALSIFKAFPGIIFNSLLICLEKRFVTFADAGKPRVAAVFARPAVRLRW